MKSKFIVLSMAILLVLAFTGFAYAKTGKDDAVVLQPTTDKSFTDEDYSNMFNFMREKGYVDMANHMESIDKDTMLRMHKSMHGEDSLSSSSRSCH